MLQSARKVQRELGSDLLFNGRAIRLHGLRSVLAVVRANPAEQEEAVMRFPAESATRALDTAVRASLDSRRRAFVRGQLMTSSPRTRPLPTPTAFSRPFWEGTQAGELRVPKCDDCSFYRWTPLPACPRCLSESFEWAQVSGRGTVYSFSVVYRPSDPVAFAEPYVVAVIRLEEGVAMLSTIVGCAPDDVRVEMPVEVAFEKVNDEITLYPFRPAS